MEGSLKFSGTGPGSVGGGVGRGGGMWGQIVPGRWRGLVEEQVMGEAAGVVDVFASSPAWPSSSDNCSSNTTTGTDPAGQSCKQKLYGIVSSCKAIVSKNKGISQL